MRSKGGILALSTIGIAAALLFVIAPGVRSSPHQPSVPETPVVLDSSSVPSLEFILSSFNVLGSRHTAPGNTQTWLESTHSVADAPHAAHCVPTFDIGAGQRDDT